MREIQEVYQRWLKGELSQEDTLFAIGDLLEKGANGGDGGGKPRAIGRTPGKLWATNVPRVIGCPSPGEDAAVPDSAAARPDGCRLYRHFLK
jgi:hypothetical protein